MERNYFEKLHQNKITSKSEVQTALVFNISKTFHKEMAKRQRFFVFQKQIKISTSNFTIKNASKNTLKQRLFFCPSKLGRTKHIETTSFFRPSKLYQKIMSNDVKIREYFLFDVLT